MAPVTIRDIRKAYGDVEVIHGLDLDIADGSFVVLLGPSGCGKSTLLRMIAGLESVTAGNISIGDRIVNKVHPKDRDIAMVFQNYALYAHMNVFDNMAFSMNLRKLPKEDIKKKVDWAASILNLTPYLERFPRQLSGGQRQRVAMGRAIVRDPSVFLFDEPLSNLDAKLRVQMRTEIKELHERLETTTVYVTHDQIEAMTMADKIVIMRDGVIEQQGSPLEVYDRPENRFVAEFIGSPMMNLLPAHIAAAAKTGSTIKLFDGSSFSVPLRLDVAPATDILFGIRPEHLKLSAHGPIKAKVVTIEPTGPEIHIYADVGGHEVCCISNERVAVARGDSITLAPAADRVHIFDAASGKRLG
jgi:multiple sugar transport system ATP-binding protein